MTHSWCETCQRSIASTHWSIHVRSQSHKNKEVTQDDQPDGEPGRLLLQMPSQASDSQSPAGDVEERPDSDPGDLRDLRHQDFPHRRGSQVNLAELVEAWSQLNLADIVEVYTTHAQDANLLLQNGWVLLGVYPLWRPRYARGEVPFHVNKGVTFVLGRPRGVEKT